MYSYRSPHMAAQKQDDQLERTFSSYVRIQAVVLKTYLGRWTIGRSGERGSGISVLPARYDDDVQQRVGERVATPCIRLTVKHGGGSVMVWGAFVNCKVGICTKWKTSWIRPTITAYCSMWSHLEQGLWVKYLYSSKLMTQSIQVNFGRDTLKVKKNSMSFNWCLADLNPIELVWDQLDQKIRAKQHTIATHF